MNSDEQTTGAPIQKSMIFLHPRPRKLMISGIIVPPRPLNARRIGGPNF